MAFRPLNSSEILQKKAPNKSLSPSICPLCLKVSENLSHIFLNGPVSSFCWVRIFSLFNLTWVFDVSLSAILLVQVCPNQVSYGKICQKLYFQNYGSNNNVSSMIKQDQGLKLCMRQNLMLQLGVPLKRSSLIIPSKTLTLIGLLFFLNLPNPMLPQFQCLQIIQTEALYCFWSLEGLPPVLVCFFVPPPTPTFLVVFFQSHSVFWTFVLSWMLLLLFQLVVLGIWCLALWGC